MIRRPTFGKWIVRQNRELAREFRIMSQGRIEHVNLTVSDIERSAAFFEKLLGWRQRWRGESMSGGETIHVGEETTYLALYTDRQDHAGQRKGRPMNHVGLLVDDPVMLDGKVVIPRGAVVIVQAASVAQSGAMKGSDQISLKANTITFGGVTYDIVTAYVETKGGGEGKKTARKVGGGVGLGAIVGGIAGGGSGAAIGAAVGGATGAVVASQGKEHLQLPAETRLQFQLTAAVTIKP